MSSEVQTLYFRLCIIYISYIDSPEVGYIIIRGANETRQFVSYSDSTRSKLDQNLTHVSSTQNVHESELVFDVVPIRGVCSPAGG